MNVSYKGIQGELPAKLQEKLDTKFAKLAKLLERRGEKEAHVVVTQERHLNHVEITLQFYDHSLASLHSDHDIFTAINGALDKLAKQAVKHRERWREKKRRDKHKGEEVAPEPPALGERRAGAQRREGRADGQTAQRVFRVDGIDEPKPMTLEEAMLAMKKDRDYLVYRDADKESVSVLVRRRDGHFDLIES